jgi:hypothetical protein
MKHPLVEIALLGLPAARTLGDDLSAGLQCAFPISLEVSSGLNLAALRAELAVDSKEFERLFRMLVAVV